MDHIIFLLSMKQYIRPNKLSGWQTEYINVINIGIQPSKYHELPYMIRFRDQIYANIFTLIASSLCMFWARLVSYDALSGCNLSLVL